MLFCCFSSKLYSLLSLRMFLFDEILGELFLHSVFLYPYRHFISENGMRRTLCCWSSAGSSFLSALRAARVPGAAVDRLILHHTWSWGNLEQQLSWSKPRQNEIWRRWAVSLSRAQHEYRSSLWAGDSSVSLRQAPGGFLEVRHVYGTLLFIIDGSCLV